MSKSVILFRDVIFKYHPLFKRSKDLQESAIKHPEIFNIPRLVEDSFAAIGPYKFIDGSHADFSDGTDSKTASIAVKSNHGTTTGNSFKGSIQSVKTSAGTLKQGALRVVIYNPHTESLMYYFLPKEFWEKNITMHNKKNIGMIAYSYNKKTDSIKKIEHYRVKSFRQLALHPA